MRTIEEACERLERAEDDAELLDEVETCERLHEFLRVPSTNAGALRLAYTCIRIGQEMSHDG